MAESKIEWRDVPGWPGVQVSRAGLIRGPSGKLLKPYIEHRGHLHVLIRHSKLRIHHAVLLAFFGPRPPGMEGRHLNGDPQDNRDVNLVWGSSLDNSADRRRHGRLPTGEKSGTAKLTEAQVLELRRRWPGETLRALGAEYGVSHTAIRRAVHGIKWGYLNG